ncbi:uncharacterized protein LOC126565908 [Anopheles maculipalpis]|uniref:uncharacterized protein LOC126565908 n=1 Tax=Anopheles maculipalpis TaxID=1496333 RepID=UPI002158B8D5|nr:uncharacterized protein LOC126565908 [Anopheles maculipalpis]
MTAILWMVLLLCSFCSGQLTNATSGELVERTVEPTVPPTQIGQWNRLKHSSMYYGGIAEQQTALSNVEVMKRDSLSSRMTSGVVGGVKILIYLFRLIGDFLRKFGAELRVAKCLLMYTFTFQPLSSKIGGGTLQSWLAGYFGAEDARDLYRFLSRNVFGLLGLSPD